MYLLFDIGATNMRLAVTRDCRKITKSVIVPTPKRFLEGVESFANTARSLLEGKRAKLVAGGCVGPFNPAKTKIANAPNLPGWNNKPLAERLSKAFKARVVLENDAAVAGLGEAVYGAGKGRGIVAYVTVSTGVGGARIVRGRIDQNSLGFEPGQQILNEQTETLEMLASGEGLEKKFGRKAYEIKDPAVWDRAAFILACGLNNTIVHWSPDAVVLGGSVMKSLPIALVRLHLKKIMKIFPKPVPLLPASLGDIGGLYGAMAMVKNGTF